MSKLPRKSTKHLFKEAPPRDLAFPSEDQEKRAIPVTAVELLVLLPNWSRTLPVAFRLISYNCTNSIAVKIINHHRTPSDKGDVANNTFCSIIMNAFRSGGLFTYPTMVNGVSKIDKWTSSHHHKSNTKDYHGVWDHKNLKLVGFKHDGHSSQEAVENVRFDSLAVGVECFPSVELGDGLNLTRCVQYAVAHPEKNLMFPKDLAYLSNLLGVYTVQPKHYDEAVVARWRGRTPYPTRKSIPFSRRLRVPGSLSGTPTIPTISTISAAIPQRRRGRNQLDVSLSHRPDVSQNSGSAAPTSSTGISSQHNWNAQHDQYTQHHASSNHPGRAIAQFTRRMSPRSVYDLQPASRMSNAALFNNPHGAADDWWTRVSQEFGATVGGLDPFYSPYSRRQVLAGDQQQPHYQYGIQTPHSYLNSQSTTGYSHSSSDTSTTNLLNVSMAPQQFYPTSAPGEPSFFLPAPLGLAGSFADSLLCGFTPPPLDPALGDGTADYSSPETLPPRHRRRYH
jgi:hypothetical protein